LKHGEFPTSVFPSLSVIVKAFVYWALMDFVMTYRRLDRTVQWRSMASPVTSIGGGGRMKPTGFSCLQNRLLSPRSLLKCVYMRSIEESQNSDIKLATIAYSKSFSIVITLNLCFASPDVNKISLPSNI